MIKQLFSPQCAPNSVSFFPSLPLTPASLLWNDRKLIHFSSHDYLGLSQHPQTRKNAIKYLLHYGAGLCHPEIKNGYLECQRQIEEIGAQALGSTQAHLFATRDQALLMLLEHCSAKEWIVMIDIYMQPIFQKALKSWGGMVYSYRNPIDLQALLMEHTNAKCLIMSESLSGSTGQITDLEALRHLAKKADALLFIDDSCAFGIKGEHGFGLAQGKSDFILCALDKAAGSQGALLACSCHTGTFFPKNTSFPRECSLPFSALGAIEAAFELIPTLEGERMQLEQRMHWLRARIKSCELNSSSHLLTIACKNALEAHHKWRRLLDQDILCEVCDIPQMQEAYLLFAINTHHTLDELSLLIEAL